MPQPEGTSPSSLMATSWSTLGFTFEGTESDADTVVLPTKLEPLYVEQVTVQVPDAEFGIWLARDTGGVQLTLVADVLLAIVPEALPKEYVRVCVKELAALEIDIEVALPITALLMLTPDFLGMV